ncbi:MAG: hypothetical protein VB140_00580 [Burkholderia sp.]
MQQRQFKVQNLHQPVVLHKASKSSLTKFQSNWLIFFEKLGSYSGI